MSDQFENKGALAKTIVVAASDSLNQGQANYVCSGANDHVEIQAALDALPATGGEVLLLDGTYYIESSLVLDSYQTLRGCGRNTILTTTTINVNIFTATGGAGTEKVGIIIADLCVDGGAGGVLNNMGIRWEFVDHSKILNVWALDNNNQNIYIRTSDNNLISGCTCQLGSEGINLYQCTQVVIVDNNCQGSSDCGIFVESSTKCVISNNFCGTNTHGIEISGSDECVVSSNICTENDDTGIILIGSSHCGVIGNNLTENSQDTNNAQPDIQVTGIASTYNLIQANVCRAGNKANKPNYGININAGTGAMVIDNDLYNDGFGTAPFNDAGTGTKLNVYVVPFSVGTDPQGTGFWVNAAAEYASAWLRLPDKVIQVVRMKVYAVSNVAEADRMRLDIIIYGGADNENFITHNGSIANHPSTSLNFAVNDIIYWTVATAGFLALVGGDSIQAYMQHEIAGGADCATNAYFRTVEIEYV